MQEINLDDLAKRFERIAKKSPEHRRALHERLGKMMLERVRQQIDTQSDSHVHGQDKGLASWQEQFVGSLGGYAAVRAKANTYATDGKGKQTDYPVGYVTNAVESGHRVYHSNPPKPSKVKRRPDYRMAARERKQVKGKGHYRDVKSEVEMTAEREIREFVEEIVKELNG